MSILGWIQAAAMIAALIALIVALIVSQRTRKQAAAQLAKSMASKWREDGYRAGILREPTTLNAGVDISCTVTEDDAIRWKVGDELIGIPAPGGHIYMSKAAADILGIDYEGKDGKVMDG
ncbi:hypothetical protein BLJ79_04220 [Arthrobacter sp. UCD-GKA]|uniref:hypothetical protein n=1 Tax=Arthrobacter sp. UCD-GKA TaxID=1913576 RepID=UPI0008DE204B|nr:hypothetical protein [Arthrobacter sp. UCD-GKA]OIH86007.1 hypothetical protein BLJ79_04220 [Arthrobacter sp. UCD-GKA]